MNFQVQLTLFKNIKWMNKKASGSLSFVYNDRQDYPYYLLNSNLNPIYNSLFLSYGPLFQYIDLGLVIIIIFFFFFFIDIDEFYIFSFRI